MSQELLDSYRSKLLKAIGHLEYSYQKVAKLPFEFKMLDEESLETWESFLARFARVADIFLSKYLRHYVELKEPGFRGTFIDSLNQAEKMGLLDQTDLWIEIRRLRNVTAHEYHEEAFNDYIARIFELSKHLMALKAIV